MYTIEKRNVFIKYWYKLFYIDKVILEIIKKKTSVNIVKILNYVRMCISITFTFYNKYYLYTSVIVE